MSQFYKGLKIKTDQKVDDFTPSRWNKLVRGASPLLQWGWFASLELSGTLKSSGFRPAHLSLFRGRKLVALVPLYWKRTLLGEWTAGGVVTQVMETLGEAPQERLIGVIPYTPVPAYRFLLDPDENPHILIPFLIETLKTIIQGKSTLIQLQHMDYSWDFAEFFSPLEWYREDSYTFRWFNRGYSTFEDFLETFPSPRRNKIRREVKECSPITFQSFKGKKITPALMERMWEGYRENINKHYSSRGALKGDFWKLLSKYFSRHLHIQASLREGEIVGMNLMVEDQKALYGRWWGAFEEVPFLHFNACYYHPIQYAIERGLEFIDPGYQGKFKKWRGFEKFDVTSLIYSDDPFLRGFLPLTLSYLKDLEED